MCAGQEDKTKHDSKGDERLAGTGEAAHCTKQTKPTQRSHQKDTLPATSSEELEKKRKEWAKAHKSRVEALCWQ